MMMSSVHEQTTIHDRMVGGEHESPSRRYLFVGGSHAIKEGNAMADRGNEVIICAASGWRPNKTTVEELVVKVEEALRELTSNDVIVLHLYDNIAYMARSEEGGDLPIRQYVNGEFHVEGDLVIAGKDRLFMYFKNTLPLLRLLDGGRVVFLIPLPRYILAVYTWLYNEYEMIVDTVLKEADSLRPGGKRSGEDISPAAKKPRMGAPRPRWIDQPHNNVMIQVDTSSEEASNGSGLASLEEAASGEAAATDISRTRK